MIAGVLALVVAGAPGPTRTASASPELTGLSRVLYRELETCVRDRAICEARREEDARRLVIRTETAAAERATPIVLPAPDSGGASALTWVLALAAAALVGGGAVAVFAH